MERLGQRLHIVKILIVRKCSQTQILTACSVTLNSYLASTGLGVLIDETERKTF